LRVYEPNHHHHVNANQLYRFDDVRKPDIRLSFTHVYKSKAQSRRFAAVQATDPKIVLRLLLTATLAMLIVVQLKEKRKVVSRTVFDFLTEQQGGAKSQQYCFKYMVNRDEDYSAVSPPEELT
jgi:hypothetical protein